MGPTSGFEASDAASRRTPSAFPAEGSLAGRYQIQRALGQGARGSVWLVRDVATGEALALKESDQVEALRNEWNCLVALRGHPRFPRPDRFFDGSRHEAPNVPAFFTMEWIEGTPLDELLPELTTEELRALFWSACSALDFVHRSGLFHGDIKPSNFVVSHRAVDDASSSRNDDLRMIDFSLSLREGEELPGWVRGTPHFAAPSILRGEPADRASDLFSLGKSFLEEGLAEERDPEFAALLRRMTEGEVGARLTTVQAVLEEGDFLQAEAKHAIAVEASLAEPPYLDFCGHLEQAIDQVCSHLASLRADPKGSRQLALNLPSGTGQTRFLTELRKGLLERGVEAAVHASGKTAGVRAVGLDVMLLEGKDCGALDEEPASGKGKGAPVLALAAEAPEDVAALEPTAEELEGVARVVLGALGDQFLGTAGALAMGTQGFVHWTVAAARALVTQGRHDLFPMEIEEGIGGSLPGRARSRLERSMAAIPMDAMAAGALALSRTPFSVQAARIICGGDAAWNKIAQSSLIRKEPRQTDEEGELVSFKHRRDAIYLASCLPPDQRIAAHATWLQELRSSGDRSPLQEFEHALGCKDSDAALRTGRDLMKEAMRTRRASEAVRALDCISSLLSRPVEETLEQAELIEYFELAGDALLASRSAKEALAMFERASALLAEDVECEVRLLRKRAVSIDALGNHQEAFDLQRCGLQHGESVSWQERVQIFERLGEFSAKLGDYAAAVDWLQQGLETPGADLESLEMSSVWNNLGIVAGLRGDMEASCHYHERALEVREAIADEEGISRSLANLGWVDLRNGNLASAEKRSARALEIKRRLGQVVSMTVSLGLLTEIYQRRGRLSDAIATAKESLHLLESVGSSEGEVQSQLTVAQLWFDLGRFDEALQHSESGLVVLRQSGLRRDYLPASLFVRAQLDAALGRQGSAVARAREMLVASQEIQAAEYEIGARAILALLSPDDPLDEALMEALEERGLHLFPGLNAIDSLLLLGEACATRGDAERALRLALVCAERAEGLKSEPSRFKAMHAEAVARLRLGEDSALASKLLHEAAAGAARVGLLELRWKCYAALAELHEQAGRRARSLGWLGQCVEVFRGVVEHLAADGLAEEYLQSPERSLILETLEARLSPGSSSSASLGGQ